MIIFLVGFAFVKLALAIPPAKPDFSFEKFLKQAEAGDAFAQYRLGNAYKWGEPQVKINYGEAAKWFQKAANQDFVDAEFELGQLYETGQGVKQDYHKALEFYIKSDRPDFYLKWRVETRIGYLFEKGCGVTQDYKEAARWYQKAAQPGNALPEAMCALGKLYARGLGVQQDYAAAARLFRATYQADCLFELGNFYAEGTGVQRDDTQAVQWWAQAADQNFLKAQIALGRTYLEGKGVPQDYAEAYFWLSLASKNGKPNREHASERLNAKRHLTSEQISGVENRILKWRTAHHLPSIP